LVKNVPHLKYNIFYVDGQPNVKRISKWSKPTQIFHNIKTKLFFLMVIRIISDRYCHFFEILQRFVRIGIFSEQNCLGSTCRMLGKAGVYFLWT